MKTMVRNLVIALAGLAPPMALMAAPQDSDWRRPWGLNLPEGVTSLSRAVYDLHMLVFWIVCVIGVAVFAGVAYSVWKFRKSKGAVAASWHHSTAVEIVWTVVPFLILLVIAVPATRTMIAMEDTSDYDMTIKVTGYQWLWHYEYLDEGVSYFSRLHPDSDRARQRNADLRPKDVENYLLEVDNPLVIPVGTRVRFLLTANDVIHSWWVPELGWKKDAIPGFINETWAEVERAGVYRGQCAELCGRDHGFMPVVVVAKEQADYLAWLDAQPRAGNGAAVAAVNAAAEVVEPLLSAGDPDLLELGRRVFAQECSSCHMPEGQGMGIFPALAGNARVAADPEWLARVMLNGVAGSAMAAFGGRLNDNEIAGVMSYIRGNWGNDADPVDPVSVRDLR
jgi:cytochrome c oxidase subunit II